MKVVGFLAPWLVIGFAVFYVAFRGGPRRAREAAKAAAPRPTTLLRVGIPIAYIALGIAIPAVIIANRSDAVGGTPRLAQEQPSEQVERGKELFRQTCATCHSLAAVNARGITGPSLDQIGAVNKQRVLSAIKVGGTGQGRMPAGLLEGENAEAVAEFVAATAAK